MTSQPGNYASCSSCVTGHVISSLDHGQQTIFFSYVCHEQ